MSYEYGGGMRLYLKKAQESEVHSKVGEVFCLSLCLSAFLHIFFLPSRQPGWLWDWCKQKVKEDTQEKVKIPALINLASESSTL